MTNEILIKQLNALIKEEQDPLANLANASALIMQTLPDLNWAGFYRYLLQKDELILGPFQGKVACVHIKNGNGVCGHALKSKSTQRIADVHTVKDHIACDSDSQSELVVPLIHTDGSIGGVLDLDSPLKNRFSEQDQKLLEDFAKNLMKNLDKPLNSR